MPRRSKRRRSTKIALFLLLSVILLAVVVFQSPVGSYLRTQIIGGGGDEFIGPPVTSTALTYLIDNTTQSGQGFTTTAGRRGWTYDTSGGYAKDSHWSSPGRGENTATWTFTNLPPGQYQVQATWTANSRRAANAPYTISDGAATLISTTVNQAAAPAAAATANGTPFQNLGSAVTTTTGTIKVTLTNAANGYVVADAVRLDMAKLVTDASICTPPPCASVTAGQGICITSDFDAYCTVTTRAECERLSASSLAASFGSGPLFTWVPKGECSGRDVWLIRKSAAISQ